MNKQSNDLTKKGTLNERQKKFCEIYADNLNITRSYMAAYPGTSETVASANGSRLLGNAKVNEYIQELIKGKRQLRIASVEEAQAILTEIAFDKSERSSDRINALDKLFKSKGQYFEGNKTDTNINISLTGPASDWSK